MPILTFAAADDVTPRIAQVRQAAINSVKVMREVLDGEADALHALRRLKFDELGHNPLGPDRWNVIEQLNQTFTYLVSLAGARWLLAKHPDAGPICLNLGTSAGSDLESMPPGKIAAEAFAATSPQSNRKLSKDLDRLKLLGPGIAHRYVFLSCPKVGDGRQVSLERGDGIEVWSFPVSKLLGE
jgi:hypothetical protein